MRDEQPLDDPRHASFLSELRALGASGPPEPSPALTPLLDADPAPLPSPPRRRN